MTVVLYTPDTVPDLLSARLRCPDYRQWRAQVQATGGCAQPVRLSGYCHLVDRDGAVLTERSGEILVPCGNRRATVCPGCSDRYCADAFHLIRAGLSGGHKDIPTTVTAKPRAFLTLTAPSFGPVHTRRLTGRGRVRPCGCGAHHHPGDPRIGSPLDPDTYDYVGSVLWQAHAGQLWGRFTTALRRALAARLDVPERCFGRVARLSFSKVAEYQIRGLVHFHAVIRIDGPDGPADPTPKAVTTELLRDAIIDAARIAVLTITGPDGAPLVLRWGAQLDIRRISAAGTRELEDPDAGQISDAALAGYIAKYSTKGTGKSEGPDRPIRDLAHVEHLDLTPHHRRIIDTVWTLGGLAQYAELNLRKWAHMLGFRGHFLTKSKLYSTTFGAIRGERRTWRLSETLAQLGRDTDDPNTTAAGLDSVTVINDWRLIGIGHRNHAERELALAIAERNQQHHQHRRTTHREEIAA